MNTMSYFLLCCSIFFTLLGFAIFYISGIRPVEKDRSLQLVLLLKDGLSSFNKRILSSILQTLTYTAIVLLLFSYLIDSTISWSQLFAFILGGTIIGINSCLYFISSPKRISHLIQRSKEHLTSGLLFQYNMSTAISFIFVGSVLSGFLISYLFLGINTIFGYVSGISVAVFFLRISGGLFKAGADISSDLVSKFEKKLSSTDERNPATILDLTGSYVGKIIGFNSDLIGSFLLALVSCVILSHTLREAHIISDIIFKVFREFPLFITMMSLVASFISYLFCIWRIKRKRVSNVLLEGLYVSIIICSISSIYYFKNSIETLSVTNVSWLSLFATYFIGLLGAGLIGFTSEYMTSYHYRPSRKIASEAEYGATVTFFNSYSVGLKSLMFYFLYLILLILPAHQLAGLYGICLSSLGMLSVTSSILVINTFSPLSSVSEKIAILSETTGQAIPNCQKMKRIGETSASLGGGFASGATIMSSLSLIISLITLISLLSPDSFQFSVIGFILLVGGLMIPYIANGFLIRKLSLLIIQTVEEVTRQIREIPYLFENKAKPDMTKASDNTSRLCNDALIVPGLLIVLTPIIIGFFLGIPYLIYYVLGLFLNTISQTFFQSNFGESANSAKHYIEEGHYGGKQSSTFENVLITDNIGDGFKDVLSPSIHIFLKTTVIITALLLVFIQ